MVIDGTKKVALDWSARGHLLIGQGNNVIEVNEFQAVQIMDFIAKNKSSKIAAQSCFTSVPGDEPSQRGA